MSTNSYRKRLTATSVNRFGVTWEAESPSPSFVGTAQGYTTLKKPTFLRAIQPELEDQKVYFDLCDEYSIALPDNLVTLLPEFEKSKQILSYEDNWDGCGASSYSSATLYKSLLFIVRFMTWLKGRGEHFIIPKIYNGPDGSIDIVFKQALKSVLINVPEDGEIAEYSAENKDQTNYQFAQGTFSITCKSFEIISHPIES